MQALLRFFELVRRELGADDVRGEVGGREPGPDVVWAAMPGGMRVVAIFDPRPADVDDKRAKLRALTDSFASLGAIEETGHSQPPRAAVGHDLDDALELLVQRARALAAIVVDDASPVIWGSSLLPHGPEDVDEARWIARVATATQDAGVDLLELVTKEPEHARAILIERGLPLTEATSLARELERLRELGTRVIDRAHLVAMRAIAAVREAEGRPDAPSMPHVLIRPFATIYRLVLVFEGPFSELHAEAALIHALPVIERLVTSLPPRDPAAGGAKVAVLRRLRPV